MALINGKEYAWAELKVKSNQKTAIIEAIVGIEYTTEQEHNTLHAAGREPWSLTSGNKSYSGTLRILQSELEALQKKFGVGKDVTDMRNFDITVAYLPEDVGAIVVDQIIEMRFTSVQKGLSSGDGHMEVELPFVALKINYNK